MELDDTPELTAYRATVRDWLSRHRHEAPATRRSRPASAAAQRAAGAPAKQADDDEAKRVDARRAWQAQLAAAGLAAVTWPVAYGGRGLSPAHELVVGQELEAAGVPGVFDIVGVGMLGPAIMAHGSESQRRRYLAPLLEGREVWCQLFSEPSAGSDLAGVQTLAERRPDGSWLVSGSKLWTTNAQHAAFGLMLARTDPDVAKHKGLTMFVVPMGAEGVTVRPLRQLSGQARFGEVFLDSVTLEPSATLGSVNEGWSVALDTLALERVTIGMSAESLSWRAEDFAAALMADDPAIASDADIRRRFGEIACELIALRWTSHRAVAAVQRGERPGPASALAKITAVNAATGAGELLCDVLGPGALDERDGWGELVSDLPGLRSAGGTEEIVRSLVGERVLGLPPEPRVDKGFPFSAGRTSATDPA